MDYFKKFQLVNYDFTTTEDFKQYLTLVDISTRVQTFYNIEDTDRLFDNYTIKSWDTPEKISYSLYGATDYYWTIMYINDIFDIYNDWPLLDNELQLYAEQLYTDIVPSELNSYSVECLPYSAGQYIIKLSPKNTISSDAILSPDKLQIGMFVDPAISGTGCKITNIQKIYKSGGLFVVDYYEVTIDKPTFVYPKPISISPNGSIYGENVIYSRFVQAIPEYDSIAYYINTKGVIKQLEYLTVNEKIYGVTKLDDLIIQNEKKKRIKVVRPDQITNFVKMYFDRIV